MPSIRQRFHLSPCSDFRSHFYLTTHLRKLEDADYVAMTKEFVDSKPRTWVEATPMGRRAFAEYLCNLEKALNWQPRG